MTAELRKFIPIGFLASLGTPVLYVAYVVGSNFRAGKEIDIFLVITIFLSTWLFSFLITEFLVFLTIVFARTLHLKVLHVPWISCLYIMEFFVFIFISAGVKQAALFCGFAGINALVFVMCYRKNGGNEAK